VDFHERLDLSDRLTDDIGDDGEDQRNDDVDEIDAKRIVIAARSMSITPFMPRPRRKRPTRSARNNQDMPFRPEDREAAKTPRNTTAETMRSAIR